MSQMTIESYSVGFREFHLVQQIPRMYYAILLYTLLNWKERDMSHIALHTDRFVSSLHKDLGPKALMGAASSDPEFGVFSSS